MIGNLGKVVCTHISKINGNYGNNGNDAHNPATVLHLQSDFEFPVAIKQTGIAGTVPGSTQSVPEVPVHQMTYGNRHSDGYPVDNQVVTNNVPVVPAVPAAKAEAQVKPAHCPWCRLSCSPSQARR